VDEGDTFCLTRCEEANDIQVDQTHFVQVERDARPSGLYLLFQFFYMLPPNAAYEPYRRPLSIRIFFDSQGHVRLLSSAKLERVHAECHLEFPWITRVFALTRAAFSAFAENSAWNIGIGLHLRWLLRSPSAER